MVDLVAAQKAHGQCLALQVGAGNDPSEMVRAAMAFALQKLGRNYIPRLVESLDSEKMASQIGDYLLELGPSIAPALVSHLQDPSPAIRGNVATVLGAVGDAATVTALQPLTGDKDRPVAQSATRAIDRIKHRAQLPKSPSSLQTGRFMLSPKPCLRGSIASRAMRAARSLVTEAGA